MNSVVNRTTSVAKQIRSCMKWTLETPRCTKVWTEQQRVMRHCPNRKLEDQLAPASNGVVPRDHLRGDCVIDGHRQVDVRKVVKNADRVSSRSE
jgi:hypothetical protein